MMIVSSFISKKYVLHLQKQLSGEWGHIEWTEAYLYFSTVEVAGHILPPCH